MARHGKPNRAWLWILIGVLVLCVAGAAVAAIWVLGRGGQPVHQDGLSTDDTSSTAPTTTTTTLQPMSERTPGNFRRPDEMKAAWLTAGVDYLTAASDTATTVQQQIDEAIAQIVEWGFNTLILPVQTGEQAVYPSTVWERQTVSDDASFDPIAYALAQAKEQELYTYLVFDFGVTREEGNDPTDAADTDTLTKAIEELKPLYPSCDGWMLTGYGYPLETEGDQTAMKQATGAMVESAVRALRDHNHDWYIGLLSSSVWAHGYIDSRGSDTDMIYEDLTDGFADTYAWLSGNWFDFVMVKADSSTVHPTAPFTTVLDWWNARCAEWNLPLYVSHAADQIGSNLRGWGSHDQIAKQLLCCQEATMWNGSAFRSYTALANDTTGSTKAVLGAYDGTLDTQFIYTELNVTNQPKTTFTTTESTVSFQGSADRNFPLTINGAEVLLTTKGYFSVSYDLSKGANKFTFSHKGKTVTYTVTYDPVIIKSFTPSNNLTVPGNSELVISAMARQSTVLYATLNGTQITMAVSGEQVDDNLDSQESDYCKYTGTYTVPAGLIGKTQSLGAVTFYATYAGMSDTKTGGAITIAAERDPSVQITVPSAGAVSYISPNVGGTVLTSGQIYMIAEDYAETFNGDTTDDYSRPTNAYLPYGTTDVYVKTVTDTSSGHSYYLFGSGRRVYTDAVTLQEAQSNVCANTFSSVQAAVSARYTTIQLDAAWRVPFNLQIKPQTYYTGNAAQPQYSLAGHGFTGEYVDITFYYTPDQPATPDVSGSALFSGAQWIKGSADNTYILRLTLRHVGGFYGYAATWDEGGSLYFRFLQPADLSGNTEEMPLQGVTVMLDPGHGGSTGDKPSGSYTLDPNLYEKTMNLEYSLLLKEKLEAKGATVLMTRTSDVSLTMQERIQMTRSQSPDLLISVHMDGVQSSTPSGASTHYFNEYSYLPSNKIYSRISEVEKKHGLGNRSVPVTWNTLYMTRTATECPTLLLECGFVTTQRDFEKLVSTSYREEFTTAVAAGIQDYFQSLPH